MSEKLTVKFYQNGKEVDPRRYSDADFFSALVNSVVARQSFDKNSTESSIGVCGSGLGGLAIALSEHIVDISSKSGLGGLTARELCLILYALQCESIAIFGTGILDEDFLAGVGGPILEEVIFHWRFYGDFGIYNTGAIDNESPLWDIPETNLSWIQTRIVSQLKLMRKDPIVYAELYTEPGGAWDIARRKGVNTVISREDMLREFRELDEEGREEGNRV